MNTRLHMTTAQVVVLLSNTLLAGVAIGVVLMGLIAGEPPKTLIVPGVLAIAAGLTVSGMLITIAHKTREQRRNSK